ncbi:MAG: DUF4105 domain-containing protein [Thermodesulfobacteriota bacterium]
MFFIFMAASTAGASDDAYLSELLNLAEEKALHEARYWQVLLHYKSRRGGMESLVDDHKFFLSPNGKRDPKAELAATIRGFFLFLFREDVENDDEHPRCRFPARYAWLKKNLDMDESGLPPVECKKFDEVMEEVNPRSAVFVFPASYMNSPASMFGHTFIRIDTTRESKLLSHAVNYAAITEETFGPFFAFKGIFGLYPGYFSILPYYQKIKEYSDVDQRDMWEYYLDLTEEEVWRMVLHIWELQGIYSDYYFFDENCSYHPLLLLEAARPSLSLSDRMGLSVIPVDTIRAVYDAGLVRKVEYRPSKATKIRYIASLLDDESREQGMDVAGGRADPGEVLQGEGGRDEKIRTLDLATEYLQYDYARGELTKEAYIERFLEILKVRGKLGKTEEGFYDIKPPSRPDRGHLSRRLSFGLGVKDDRGFQELRFRPAYHALLDPGEGYIEGSQIEFFDTALRYYPSDGKVELEAFEILDIVSLAPRDRLFKTISWKVMTGFEQRLFPDKNDHLVYRLGPAGGVVYKGPLAVGYAMVESDLLISGRFDESYALGLGLSGGVIGELTERWKAHLSFKSLWYEFGDEHRRYEAALRQSFQLGTNSALSLDIMRERSFGVYWTEARVGWRMFF